MWCRICYILYEYLTINGWLNFFVVTPHHYKHTVSKKSLGSNQIQSVFRNSRIKHYLKIERWTKVWRIISIAKFSREYLKKKQDWPKASTYMKIIFKEIIKDENEQSKLCLLCKSFQLYKCSLARESTLNKNFHSFFYLFLLTCQLFKLGSTL